MLNKYLKNKSLFWIKNPIKANIAAVILLSMIIFIVLTLIEIDANILIINFRTIIIGTILGVCTYYIMIIISKLLKYFKISIQSKSIIKSNLNHSNSRTLNIFFSVIIIIQTALIEELIFRYIMLLKLFNLSNYCIAILISSVIFAFIHFNKKAIQLFVLGVIFSGSFFYFDSLIIPIIAHIINNLLVLLFHLKINKNEL